VVAAGLVNVTDDFLSDSLAMTAVLGNHYRRATDAPHARIFFATTRSNPTVPYSCRYAFWLHGPS
jgi:hypothetical protein